MTKKTINYLRFVSVMEGIAYLLLLGVGMPLKYGFDIIYQCLFEILY